MVAQKITWKHIELPEKGMKKGNFTFYIRSVFSGTKCA